MDKLNEIFNKYEGKSVDSLDRKCGRRNFILYIIKTFSENMSKHDDKLNLMLINEFIDREFINKISIENNHCVIDYFDDYGVQNIIEFDIISDSLSLKFGDFFFNKELKKYQFTGECHGVTLKFLELYPDSGLNAVTSLCENMNNILYFHSYLWDKSSDTIIDFARNLVMKKSNYDKLFVYDEINVLSDVEIDYSLLYLALVKLYDKENKANNVKRKNRLFGFRESC